MLTEYAFLLYKLMHQMLSTYTKINANICK